MLGCTKLFFGKANLRQSGKKLEVIILSFHVFNIIINKEKTSTKLLKGDLSSCLKAYKYQYIPANTVILERSTASVLTMLLQNIYLSYLK